MSKSERQKLKLLYLQKILMEKTDEDHAITVPQMISELARYGISAERKALYNDLEALQLFGLDIVCRKTRTNNYYLASKTFELPELKLLADAVASSKFITEKKSNELIKKIESLASAFEAKQLQRQVHVNGRIKKANEKIYYVIDTIHQAISQNRQISFRYFDYNIRKEKQYRNQGEPYTVSPYALCWEDENYYLVCYYPKHDLTHFRVDKIDNVDLLIDKRVNLKLDLPAHLNKSFLMYGGKEASIRLQFDNSLISVVLDRFGTKTILHPADENSFIVNVEAYLSPTLLGWLFTFGNKVKVLSPQSLIVMMVTQSRELLEQY